MNSMACNSGTTSNEDHPPLTLEILEKTYDKVREWQKDVDISFSQFVDQEFPDHNIQEGENIRIAYSDFLKTDEAYLIPSPKLSCESMLPPKMKQQSDWLIVGSCSDFKTTHKQLFTYRRGFLSKERGDSKK